VGIPFDKIKKATLRSEQNQEVHRYTGGTVDYIERLVATAVPNEQASSRNSLPHYKGTGTMKLKEGDLKVNIAIWNYPSGKCYIKATQVLLVND